jgi:hypothetical protein
MQEQVREMHLVLCGSTEYNQPGLAKRIDADIKKVAEVCDKHERRLDQMEKDQIHQGNDLRDVQKAQAKIIALAGSVGGGIGAIVGGVVTFVVDHWSDWFGK